MRGIAARMGVAPTVSAASLSLGTASTVAMATTLSSAARTRASTVGGSACFSGRAAAPGTSLQRKKSIESRGRCPLGVLGANDIEIDGLVALLFLKVLIGHPPAKLHVQLALELAGFVTLLGHDEGRRHSLGTCAAGAADAMDEVITGVGKVVVDDV